MTLVINQCQLTSGGSVKSVSENLILSRQFSSLFLYFSPSSLVTEMFTWCEGGERRNGNIYWLYWILISSLAVHSSGNPLISIYLIFRKKWTRRRIQNGTSAFWLVFAIFRLNNYLKKGFSVCGILFMGLRGNLFNPHIMMTTSNTHCCNPF